MEMYSKSVMLMAATEKLRLIVQRHLRHRDYRLLSAAADAVDASLDGKGRK